MNENANSGEGSKNFFAILGVATLLVLVVAGMFLALPGVASLSETQTANFAEDEKDEIRTISVSGISEISVAPEKVDIYLSVVSEKLKAKDSQADNATVSQKVIAALLAAGVKKENIETTSYSLQKIQEWDPSYNKLIEKGYRTTNSIKVTVANINDAGKVIDAAAAAGANQVDNIVFGIKKETEDRLKLEALQNASAESMKKAKIMAQGVGVKVVELQTMSENSYVYQPLPYYKSFDAAAPMTEGGASTEFFAGNIKVSASVQATYVIG